MKPCRDFVGNRSSVLGRRNEYYSAKVYFVVEVDSLGTPTGTACYHQLYFNIFPLPVSSDVNRASTHQPITNIFDHTHTADTQKSRADEHVQYIHVGSYPLPFHVPCTPGNPMTTSIERD